jgi:hypothetical protein
MMLRSLEIVDPEVVLAKFEVTKGEVLLVKFLVAESDSGELLINPDRDVFSNQPMTAADVRAVAALVAEFYRLAGARERPST